MLTKLRAFASLYRELGPRWTLFRLAYAFRLRTGLLRLQMPIGRWEDYKKHVGARRRPELVEGSSRPDLQIPKELPPTPPWNPKTAIDDANRLLNGELKYFSHHFIQTGFPPNWHADYVTLTLSDGEGEGSLPPQSEILRRSAAQNDINRHWSQIPDDSSTDIKFIWEPNRFAFVYTLVRAYVTSRNEIYSDAFWVLIYFWDKYNFPNWGPNWMDGQEISLRLMAWTFGYHAFLTSPSSTPERLAQFTLYVAAQAERIYRNRSFAVSSHNNHCITEAFALWMVGLLFPELKNAEKYRSFGHASLEREARTQIFPDGTYSMYSLNYHRFVLQIYLYALQLAKLNNASFSEDLKKRITASLEYLAQLIDPQTGQMPVYGSNDGALVLPLNNCDFTDYRPLLQLGWHITKGERLFEPGPWDEDLFWLCGVESLSLQGRGAGVRVQSKSFPDGGIYLLRSVNSRVIIRCTDFTSRPSHADQLHVDLWIRGQNIAIDAGTYLYSGEDQRWRNGLAHTSVHNTVTVDDKDQMTMLSRFTWTNWSKGSVLKHEKDLWQGEHDGYKPVSHRRTVMALDDDRWLVIDDLDAKEAHRYSLQWLLPDFGIQKLASGYGLLLTPTTSKLVDSRIYIQMGMTKGNADFSLVRADPNSTRGWRSRYYGHKEPAISVMLETDQPQVTFWTFFGVEGDRVELAGDTLRVNKTDIVSLSTVDRRR